ncbi:hypothetical protein DMN91_006797 [Ooceraea biroi]|uniref:Uncharacterized protein n=2 Tax=Ooceraea biroi TaxID=2015173 RepID=A0A3L8DIC5_OOCBI|nr:hypothetical protein DMN91_006797 [Ooceraea biroi]
MALLTLVQILPQEFTYPDYFDITLKELPVLRL